MKRILLPLAALAALTLSLGMSIAQSSHHEPLNTVQAQDDLDPNDCSRGIDESNQETCGGDL